MPGDVGSRWSTVAMAEQDATIAEGDESNEPASDNSIGRLLALSDGVFAIAMTLLALDLRLPDLGANPSDIGLLTALPALTALALAIPFGRMLQRRRNIVPWYSRLRLLAWSSYALMAAISALKLGHFYLDIGVT